MAVSDPELLNTVYKEISEQLGMDSAMTMDYSGFYLLKQEDVEKADSFVRDEGGEMSDSGRTQ